MHRARRWAFTINNYQAADVQAVIQLSQSAQVLERVAEYRYEGTPQNNPHIQGYVHLNWQAYENQINARPVLTRVSVH
jgi:hypothetical protein